MDWANVSTPKRTAFVAAGAFGVAALAVLFLWRSSPPQMGGDEEVVKTLDALFTAVAAKDVRRLSECEQRLNCCRKAGKLPPDAASALDAVIAEARSGSWQIAAERLYNLIRGQKW